MKLKPILYLASTTMAVWLSGTWALVREWPISVLFNFENTEETIKVIKRIVPFHLVKPEWVKPGPDGVLIIQWLLAETKTRLALIGLVWVLLMVAIWKMKKKGASHTHGGLQLPANGLKPSDSEPSIG